MSELYGSSRIPQISSTVGNILFEGPTGSTGPTGPAGEYVTGPDGPRGRYVYFVEGVSADTIKISLKDNDLSATRELYVSGVRGITGDNTLGVFSVGYTGITENAFYIPQGPIGLTLFFKAIQLQGKITGSYANNNLFIDQSEIPYTGDLTPNRLLYIGYTSTNEYYVVIPASNSIYEERLYSGKTFSSLETLFYGFKETGTGSNFNYSTNSSRDDANLNIDINGSFYGMTFINSSLNFSESSPYLRYGVSYEKVNENTAFQTDTIKFRKRGNFNKKIGEDTFIPLNEKIGSCCYCDAEGKRYCKDYVLKEYCNSGLVGSWSPTPCYLRYNTDDCYPGGACCVNGKCVLSSEDKCISMGGLFVVGQNCSSLTCPDACVSPGCCCVKGTGYELTEELCAEISGSRYFPEGCDSVNCCQVGHLGACCVKKVCYDYFSAYECAATGGVFQGVGSACISQFLNCCTDPSGPIQGTIP